MAIVTAEGFPADRNRIKVGPPRGKSLSDAEVREWNDLFYTILLEHGGMSLTDATAVMARSFCKRHVKSRVRLMRPVVHKHGIAGVMGQLMRKAEAREPAVRKRARRSA